VQTKGVVVRNPLRMPVPRRRNPRQQTQRHVHPPGDAVVGTVVVVVAVAAADVAAVAHPTDIAVAYVYVVAAAIAADPVAVAVVGYEGIVIVGVVGLLGGNHLLQWRTAVGVAAAVVIAAVFVANGVGLYHPLLRGGLGSYQNFLLLLIIAAAVAVGTVVVGLVAAAVAAVVVSAVGVGG